MVATFLNDNIVDCFYQALFIAQFQLRWIADKNIVAGLKLHFPNKAFITLSTSTFNRAIPKDNSKGFSNIHEERNLTGILSCKFRVAEDDGKKRNVTFYFINKNSECNLIILKALNHKQFIEIWSNFVP